MGSETEGEIKMFMEMLLLFVVIVIIMLILSVYTMDESPSLSIPLIMVGIIFTVLCAYGVWNVEYIYVGTNVTTGLMESQIYSTDSYGNPYSYIFMTLCFIFVMFFFRAGFNLWKESLQTKGQMDLKKRY